MIQDEICPGCHRGCPLADPACGKGFAIAQERAAQMGEAAEHEPWGYGGYGDRGGYHGERGWQGEPARDFGREAYGRQDERGWRGGSARDWHGRGDHGRGYGDREGFERGYGERSWRGERDFGHGGRDGRNWQGEPERNWRGEHDAPERGWREGFERGHDERDFGHGERERGWHGEPERNWHGGPERGWCGERGERGRGGFGGRGHGGPRGGRERFARVDEATDALLVRRFHHCAHLLMHRRAKEGGRAGVLMVLNSHGSVTQRALAEKLDIRSASASELLTKMESAALIERMPDPNDGRATLVSLTEKGREEAAVLAAQREEANKNLFAALTDEEKAQLEMILAKLTRSWHEEFDRNGEAKDAPSRDGEAEDIPSHEAEDKREDGCEEVASATSN